MSTSIVIEPRALQDLIDALVRRGNRVIGPRLDQGTVVYGPVERLSDLPIGCIDEQDAGHYRLRQSATDNTETHALFGYAVGPHSWKRYLFPPHQILWHAHKEGMGFRVETAKKPVPEYAFLGVRACELAAIAIQDRVFDNGEYADSEYRARRRNVLLIAVSCSRAGGTCFCASTGSGPQVKTGYDLCLTELVNGGNHRFVVDIGSDAGAELAAVLPHRPARREDLEEAQRRINAAAANMGRGLDPEAANILQSNPEHPRWQEVAQRCLSCANCTLVCPTCFCSSVSDSTSLDGTRAERRRHWDSCFNLDFSYIHGGPVRREGAARYRQWITHKLSSWHQQFGTSGCTGCGRCITWCPVGIDITQEVAAIRDSEPPPPEGGD